MNHLQDATKKLCEIVTAIDNTNDAFLFLRDLLTEPELTEFSQRLVIAQLLANGISYKEIEKETGASSTTIARVGKYLKWKNGGYRKFLGGEV